MKTKNSQPIEMSWKNPGIGLSVFDFPAESGNLAADIVDELVELGVITKEQILDTLSVYLRQLPTTLSWNIWERKRFNLNMPIPLTKSYFQINKGLIFLK
ncbi:MAG: hypothetical protein ABIP78_09840 [Pyrinomonadaceae bacterium]